MVRDMITHFGIVSLLLAVLLFAGILLCLEIGRRLGMIRRAADPDSVGEGVSAVDGAVFGLMGLLIAFTFSGALQRWDVRRAQVVEEANDVGTAWLRIDLLPVQAQPPLRDLFRRYLDSRLAVYQRLPDPVAARAELVNSEGLQREIWKSAAAACLEPDGERARILLLPALNAMIDITTVRTMALLTHPPLIVYVLLLSLLLASSLIAGYAMAGSAVRNWVHMLCFAAAMSISVYVILDLEYPRAGLFRIDHIDQVLIDLRAGMK
jgi:hypothetical protein